MTKYMRLAVGSQVCSLKCGSQTLLRKSDLWVQGLLVKIANQKFHIEAFSESDNDELGGRDLILARARTNKSGHFQILIF
jgi:hypothetical protein